MTPDTNAENNDSNVPQFVEVQIGDAAMKNLQAGGEHHVVGEGTHVLLKYDENLDEPERAEAEPMFRIVEDDEPKSLFRRLFR